MPIMHIVLFKLKEGVSEDAIKAMNEAVSSMGKLDCVQSINCGTNFTDRGRGYNYGLAAICKDKAALQEYAVDPYHTEVKEKFLFVNCIKEETMAVDWEF